MSRASGSRCRLPPCREVSLGALHRTGVLGSERQRRITFPKNSPENFHCAPLQLKKLIWVQKLMMWLLKRTAECLRRFGRHSGNVSLGDQSLACFRKSRLESLGTVRPQQADFIERLCGQPPRGPGEETRGGPLPAPPSWSPRPPTEAAPWAVSPLGAPPSGAAAAPSTSARAVDRIRVPVIRRLRVVESSLCTRGFRGR